jgi:hypothetical protein
VGEVLVGVIIGLTILVAVGFGIAAWTIWNDKD